MIICILIFYEFRFFLTIVHQIFLNKISLPNAIFYLFLSVCFANCLWNIEPYSKFLMLFLNFTHFHIIKTNYSMLLSNIFSNFQAFILYNLELIWHYHFYLYIAHLFLLMMNLQNHFSLNTLSILVLNMHYTNQLINYFIKNFNNKEHINI